MNNNHWHVGGHNIPVGIGVHTTGDKRKKDVKESVKEHMGEDLEKLALNLIKADYNVESFTITRSNGNYRDQENELTIHTRDGKEVTITIQK